MKMVKVRRRCSLIVSHSKPGLHKLDLFKKRSVEGLGY